MKKTVAGSLGAGLMTMALVGAGLATQNAPQKASPEKQHEWLQQLVGEWQLEAECSMPGMPPEKSKGQDSVHALGDLWVVSETEGTFMDEPVAGMMTLGYDTERDKFVGTSVCDSSTHLWEYTGTLDASGKVLTLETEGPDPATGAKARFKDVIEIKDRDTRVMTSSMQGKDGNWTKIMTMTFRRTAG
jgi:Protein of unknown function (DUF1579)